MSLIRGPSTTGDPAQTPGLIDVPAMLRPRQRRAASRGRGAGDRTRSRRGTPGEDPQGGTSVLAAGGPKGSSRAVSLTLQQLTAGRVGACFLALKLKTYSESGLADTPVRAGFRRAVIRRTPAVRDPRGSQRGPSPRYICRAPQRSPTCPSLSARVSALTLPESIKDWLPGNLNLPSNHLHIGPR